MYRWIYDKIVFPAWHYAQGDGANTAIRVMDQHDSLSAESLQEIERTKLEALLLDAHRSVPYYRQVLGNAGVIDNGRCVLENFSGVPLLTKDAIRSNADRLVTESLDGNRLDPNSTSGSSGSPLQFQTDIRSKCGRKGAVHRNRKWLGIRRGDPVMHLWGSPLDASKASAFRGKIHGLITREMFLSAYHLNETDMTGYAEQIRRFRPRLLIGYPTILETFGRFCEEHGIRFPSLHAIVCSAETLYPYQRKSIESTLATPVFNRYGCREVGDIAHEIPRVNGLVVNSDRILVEILDDEGRPCRPGQTGEIVVTDLDNYGMPLIRYRVGDRGAWSETSGREASCPWPVLSHVEGRVLDVVRTPDGNNIGGTYWTILLRQRPGIEFFQVIQEKLDGITVRFVKSTGEDSIDEAWFSAQIRKLCGDDFSVRFEEVERIPPDKTGKMRIVISRLADVVPTTSEIGAGK